MLGFVSATGCAGLTLGGGFGYLTRRFGWSTDNLAAVDLVTADGRVVRASEQENADLLGPVRRWRQFRRRHRIRIQAAAGGSRCRRGPLRARRRSGRRPRSLSIHRDRGAARADLRGRAGWRRRRPGWRRRCTASRSSPSSSAIRDRSRTPNECWRRSRLRKPGRQHLQRRTHVSQQALLDATQPKGRRYYWKSEYLRAFDPALFTGAIDHASRIVSPHAGDPDLPDRWRAQRTARGSLRRRQPRRRRRAEHRRRGSGRR